MKHQQDERPRREVLYVEDHPVSVMLMRAIFERCPTLRLVVAWDGKEALRQSPGLLPALLLLDLRLPDCHGSQLLALLRLNAGFERVPAVAVTAQCDFDVADTNFCERWAKPLDLAQVMKRLDALTRTPGERPMFDTAHAGLHRPADVVRRVGR